MRKKAQQQLADPSDDGHGAPEAGGARSAAAAEPGRGRQEGNSPVTKGRKRQRKSTKEEATIKPEDDDDVTPPRVADAGSDPEPPVEPPSLSAAAPGRAVSALQQSFLSRLSGSRFRELNEKLYTSESSDAFAKFTAKPELFDAYHAGFRSQVDKWPVNPVNVIIRWIRGVEKRSRGDRGGRKLAVADFGCGEAELARELLEAHGGGTTKKKRKMSQKTGGGVGVESENDGCLFAVHSFDLVSNGNPLITPADMANVPMPSRSVDVAIFCLALMGTNIADFIREAHRVLRDDGVLKIAEVRSRFETAMRDDGDGGGAKARGRKGKKGKNSKKQQKQSGGALASKRVDEGLLDRFVDVMEQLGFQCAGRPDKSNKMFLVMEFVKNGEDPSREASFTAKPCIYKRR